VQRSFGFGFFGLGSFGLGREGEEPAAEAEALLVAQGVAPL
jgi:hypothetical protein